MTLTYNGSSAGSTLANPPVLLAAALGGHAQWVTSGTTDSPVKYGSGAKLWLYTSTNAAQDVSSTLGIAFGDGGALGMTNGDVLIGVQTSAGSTTPFCYLAVLCSSAGSTGFSISTSYLSSTAV